MKVQQLGLVLSQQTAWRYSVRIEQFDHTVANLQILKFYFQDCSCYLFIGLQIIEFFEATQAQLSYHTFR